MRQENLVGTIEVNKAADLIVIDQNLFNIAVNRISNTRVDLTILAGEVIHRR